MLKQGQPTPVDNQPSIRMFGSSDTVDPVRHFLGTAGGWGALPRNAAMYLIESVDMNGCRQSRH
jgi:hypothetical protein